MMVLPGFARADNQGIALRPVGAGAFGVGAHCKAGAAQHHDGEEQINDDHRAGISRKLQNGFDQAENQATELSSEALVMSSRSLMPT